MSLSSLKSLNYIPKAISALYYGCVPLGWSGSGLVVESYSDHGASKELMNPLWSRIHQLL